MTTEIKLGGERLRQWLAKNSERNFCYLPTGPEFLIANLPDVSGLYDTPPFGELSIMFGSTMAYGMVRHSQSPAVMLNCENIKLLQARTNHRYRKAVNINRKGIGRQQLDKGVDLIITTGFNFDEIRGSRND